MTVSRLTQAGFQSLRAQMAQTLARAFDQDPGIRFIYGPDREITEKLTELYSILLDSAFRYGYVIASSDGKLASLWRRPGQTHDPAIRTVIDAPRYMSALGACTHRAARMDKSIAAHHPNGRYHYLHVLGCHPDAQGQGLARQAIELGHAIAQKDNCGVFLETSLDANLPIYERMGFVAQDSWTIPGSGPRFTGMFRA